MTIKTIWAALAGLLIFAHGAQAETVEILTLKLAKGVSYAQFEPVQKAVGEQYAMKQPGFISRRSLRGENGEWSVIVRWQDKQSAEASMKKFANDPTARKFMQMIQPASMKMTRYESETVLNQPSTHKETQMTQLSGNAKIVADYLDVVFNQKDLAKAETFWAGDMIQHNPQMPNGLDVLRGFIQSPDAKGMGYQRGIIMQDGDYVMAHGRYTGWAGKTMIATDIFRLVNGKVVEHWDVMQEEVPADKAVNGNPMFPVK